MTDPPERLFDGLDDFRSEQGFLVHIDSMIESTAEFVVDDKLTRDNDPEGRLKDLDALTHVRELFLEVFAHYNHDQEN